MNKQRIEYIEALEEEMMDAWNNHYSTDKGLIPVGNMLKQNSRCYYDADKRKIMKKKRWDKECDKFIEKMESEIRKYS